MDQEITEFLSRFPQEINLISFELMKIVREVVPSVKEKYYKGWKLIGYRAIHGKKDFYFCFVAPYKSHVDLGFEYGTMMNDPLSVLSGSGKQVKLIRCSNFADTQKPFLPDYIKEGLEIARSIRFGKAD